MKLVIEINLSKKQEKKLKKAILLMEQLQMITGTRLMFIPDFLENAKLFGIKIKPDDIMTRLED